MADHTCHATCCKVSVPPKMFMCREHWFSLPRSYRDAILRAYEPGQEITKDPSMEYLRVARAAVLYLERVKAGS